MIPAETEPGKLATAIAKRGIDLEEEMPSMASFPRMASAWVLIERPFAEMARVTVPSNPEMRTHAVRVLEILEGAVPPCDELTKGREIALATELKGKEVVAAFCVGKSERMNQATVEIAGIFDLLNTRRVSKLDKEKIYGEMRRLEALYEHIDSIRQELA